MHTNLAAAAALGAHCSFRCFVRTSSQGIHGLHGVEWSLNQGYGTQVADMWPPSVGV